MEIGAERRDGRRCLIRLPNLQLSSCSVGLTASKGQFWGSYSRLCPSGREVSLNSLTLTLNFNSSTFRAIPLNCRKRDMAKNMDFPMSELKQAALEYAQRGWHVFPCKPDGKIPLTPNGQNAASLDQIQIELWWDQWPQANIGIFLAPSGLMAIDVDSYKPDCEWDAFIGGKDFDPQCVQRSARGGTHYIFKAGHHQTFKPPCKGVDMKHNVK